MKPDHTTKASMLVMILMRSAFSPEGSRLTAPMRNADAVTDLFVTFREAGIHLAEMSVQKPTLDEVFLTLTGHGVEEEKNRADEPTDTDKASTSEGVRA